ncbi:MAG: hypothetical protein ABI210_05920 [Abditibacteriaceae bacterium]
MSIEPKLIPILIVALITWGGIFLYLLRVEMLTRKVQKELDQRLESVERTEE